MRTVTKATARWVRGALAGTAVLAVAGDKNLDESPLDKEAYRAVMAGEAREPGDLLARYDEARWLYLPILPPDPDFILQQPVAGMVVPFDWPKFPEMFNAGLLPRWENTVPVFDLTLAEDPLTRDTIFYNGLGAAIWRIAPEPGYDPWSFLRTLSPLALSGDLSADAFYAIRRLWDPARVQARLTLIRPEHVEYYLYAAAKIDEAAASPQTAEPDSGGMMMMLLGDPEFEFSAIAKLTNGLQMTVTFPSEFTNRMDIFSSTNLVEFSWQVAASALSTTGGSPLVWTDSSFPSTWRVYAAGDADLDSDADGLADAREFFVYHTCPTNLDTDADGLVDGYSGVVSTNSYSGGVHSNGNGYVEGELSWGTSALLGDSDDDGVSDGEEVANGTDPLDPDHPPSAGGTVSYSGQQTGAVVVVAVLASNDWSRTHSASNSTPGAYRVGGLSSNLWYLKAYRDSNGNGTNDVYEAAGEAAGNPVLTTNRVCGIDIVLDDPDSDTDGLPDWWEMEYWASLEYWASEDDPDEDGYSNEDEYYAWTDPTDADSHPWDVSGLVTYSGAQTGTVYVVGLDAAGSVVASTVADAAGCYRLVQLPVGGEYDIRAFMDSDCTTTQDFGEAWAQWPSSLVLTQDVADVDLELADPDTDGDGLPDYWEELYGLDPLNGGAADACAWWKLDETSGTNVFDSTEGASTGTVQNAASPGWTNGVIGGALLFDGVDDVVTVPDGDWLNPSFVTVSFWLNAATAQTDTVYVSKKDPGSASGYEVSYTNGQLRFVVGATSEKALLATCTLTNGGWYHVAGVYGGATQSLYLNGVRVALTNYSLGTSMGEMGASTNSLTLGAAGPAAARPFAGMLDDVRLYPFEMSSNAVVAIWQVGQDVDGDGLGAAAEFAAGGSPESADTDGDGLTDMEEVAIYGTSLINPDSDGDGLTDWEEVTRIGSSALLANPLVDLVSTQVVVEYKMIASQRHKCGFGPANSTNLPLFYLEAERSVDSIAASVPWSYYYCDRSSNVQDDDHTMVHCVNPTNALWVGSGTDNEYSYWIEGEVEYSRTINNSWASTNFASWGIQETLIRPSEYHTGSGTIISNGTFNEEWENDSDWWTDWGSSANLAICLDWTFTNSPYEVDWIHTYGSGGDENGCTGTTETVEYRDIEFTTPDLIALATGDLARTTWTEINWGARALWINDAGTTVSNAFGGQEHPQEWVAYRWQSPNEVTQHLAKLMYRLRVVGATNGTVYRMTVCHLETPEGTNTSQAVAISNYVGLCSDASGNFYLSASGTVIEPPSSNASIRLDWPSVTLSSVTNLRSATVGDFAAITDPHCAGRIFVDTTEAWGGGGFDTNQFDKQRIAITAIADLKGLPTNACRIRWAVYDPDDPATNTWADRNDVAGGDNTGTQHEGGDHWFAPTNGNTIETWDHAVPGQPESIGVLLETADTPVLDLGNGQYGASVILNVSDDGGDNYRVRAHLTVEDDPVAGDTGGLWTMWRKRFLKVHAMKKADESGILFPATTNVTGEATIEGLRIDLWRAYANTNCEKACYVDIKADVGTTNMTHPDYLFLCHETCTEAWARYAWTNLHDAGSSIGHVPCEFHVIGVDRLHLNSNHSTEAGGKSDGDLPDLAVAVGWADTNGAYRSMLAMHELGHAFPSRGNLENHDGHTPRIDDETGAKDPNCAFGDKTDGNFHAVEICERHSRSVRSRTSRSWSDHVVGDTNRASWFDSPDNQ